ncbi:MAG: hypothetical protein AAF593_06275 [Planctomycetota bacterium]
MIVHPFEISGIRELVTGSENLKRAEVAITLQDNGFRLTFSHELEDESRGKSRFFENEEFLAFIRAIPHDDIVVVLSSWLTTHLRGDRRYPTPFPINEEAQNWRILDERESTTHRARLDFLREHGLGK